MNTQLINEFYLFGLAHVTCSMMVIPMESDERVGDEDDVFGLVMCSWLRGEFNLVMKSSRHDVESRSDTKLKLIVLETRY
jgi:hypothetical protein